MSPSFRRSGSTILVWVDGNWRILKEHLSEAMAVRHLELLEREKK